MAKSPFPQFGSETYQKIFTAAYQGLTTNLLLLAFSLPLVVGFTVIRDPLSSWPFLFVLGLPCGPAVAGAFGAFRRSRDEDAVRPLRQFLAGWRATWWRAFLVWGTASVALVIVIVDVAVVRSTPFGALLTPALLVLGVLALVLAFYLLVGVAEFPAVRLRDILKWSFFLAVRQWYFALFAVLMLFCIVVAFVFQPVIGIFVTPSFLLFLVWANTRRGFERLLEATGATAQAN